MSKHHATISAFGILAAALCLAAGSGAALAQF